MRRTGPYALVAALTLLCSASAAAQESTTRGFIVGIHGSAASLAVESQERNNAGGGGLIVGYGVNRRVTIIAQADAAEFDDQSTGEIQGTWTMGHFDVGVRFNFANSLRMWVPYLQGTIGARAVSVENPIVNGIERDEVSLTGGSLTLGGGVDLYFTETFALDLQLLWSGGEFNTIRVNNTSQSGLDFDAQSTRFNIGIVWWP